MAILTYCLIKSRGLFGHRHFLVKVAARGCWICWTLGHQCRDEAEKILTPNLNGRQSFKADDQSGLLFLKSTPNSWIFGIHIESNNRHFLLWSLIKVWLYITLFGETNTMRVKYSNWGDHTRYWNHHNHHHLYDYLEMLVVDTLWSASIAWFILEIWSNNCLIFCTTKMQTKNFNFSYWQCIYSQRQFHKHLIPQTHLISLFNDANKPSPALISDSQSPPPPEI